MGESGAGGTSSTISRRKSLKKSLRESFRKLRRGRSQKPGAKKPDTSAPVGGITSRQLAATTVDDDLADGALHRPIERQVESREFKPVDDIPASVIRYIYFVRTHITSNQQQTNSMWVGTNTGIIYIYALQFVAGSGAAAGPGPSASGSKSISGKLIISFFLKILKIFCPDFLISKETFRIKLNQNMKYLFLIICARKFLNLK